YNQDKKIDILQLLLLHTNLPVDINKLIDHYSSFICYRFMNHQLLLFDYYQKKWIPQGFHLPKDRQWQSSFCVSNTDIFMMHGFIDAHPLTSYYAQAFQFNFISHN